jgi:hypothetical protein
MPPQQRLWLNNEEGLLPGPTILASKTRSMRSVLLQAGRFTCRGV